MYINRPMFGVSQIVHYPTNDTSRRRWSETIAPSLSQFRLGRLGVLVKQRIKSYPLRTPL